MSIKSGEAQPEFFADHTAIAAFSASLLNPNTEQLTIYIDRYTIDYTTAADSPLAPPIQSDSRNETFSFTVAAGAVTQVNTTVTFVDLIRKLQYYNDLQSALYSSSQGLLNNYTATYTFYGHNDRGNHFTLSAQASFQIGSFNYCQ